MLYLPIPYKALSQPHMHFLYLAYYYPPCNSVSAYRPLSHVNNLIEKGHKVTVLTRNWEGNEKGWTDYIRENTKESSILTNGNLEIHFLPYFSSTIVAKPSLFSKIKFLARFLKGNFHPEINGYDAFHAKADELIVTSKIDCIIISSPPFNLLKLAHELNKKSGNKIKIVADFRDLWDSDLLINDKKFTLSQKIKNKIFAFYFRKWTRSPSVMVTTVSEVLSNILSSYNGKKTGVFLNGYEDHLMASVTKVEYPKFTFSSIGTMYAFYNTDNLIEGLNRFLKNKSPEKISINFIGITAVPEVAERLKNGLPHAFITISDRVPKKEALTILKSSHVLFHTAVKEFQGAYTTKIFDYVGSGNNILISPGDDGGIIDSLVLETKTGKIARDPEQFAAILEDWYTQWETGKTLHYEGISGKSAFYSRSVQANNFVDTVLHWLT
jgi:hypothetical protein